MSRRYEEERFGAQHTLNRRTQDQKMQDRRMQDQRMQDRRMQDQKMQDQRTQDQRIQDRKMQDRRIQEQEQKIQDPRMQNQRLQDQGVQSQRTRTQNPNYPSEEVRRSAYQPGDIQRRQQAAYEAQRRRPVNDIRAQRYQQESLAGDWQQDWNRTPYDNRNDKRFTGGQLVLTLVIITLVIVMTAMAVFWYTGRSSLRDHADTGRTIEQREDRTVSDEVPDDNIVILDIESNE